jgi:hypothetical protein
MSKTNSSTGKNAQDTPGSGTAGEESVQKHVVNLIFLIIVMVMSLLVLALVLFDRQPTPTTTPDGSWQQEQRCTEEGPPRSFTNVFSGCLLLLRHQPVHGNIQFRSRTNSITPDQTSISYEPISLGLYSSCSKHDSPGRMRISLDIS